MKKLMTLARQFRDEEDGAAMIEYSVLIGIITAATITLILAVGAWVTGAWTYLNSQLGSAPG
jgi:pilus assembly protein Flp/PilA